MTEHASELWNDYHLTWIKEPGALPPSEQHELLCQLRDLTNATYRRDVGGYFLNQKDYLRPISRMVLVRREGELVGFLAFDESLRAAEQPVLYLTSAVVRPDQQRKGLSVYAVARVMTDFLETKPELIFAMRTQNPVVYAPFAFAVPDLYPSVAGRPAPEKIKRAAAELAKQLSPECVFDSEHFVIEGLYRFSQRFFDDLPSSGVAMVDAMFRTRLNPERQDGFLIVGELSIASALAVFRRFPAAAALCKRLELLLERRSKA
jgi:hypothetical protein